MDDLVLQNSIMRTRHITLSKQQGMITELELVGGGLDAGDRYMLRYQMPASDSVNVFDVGNPDLRSVSWTGFRYRDEQISVLLQRQGQSSAEA